MPSDGGRVESPESEQDVSQSIDIIVSVLRDQSLIFRLKFVDPGLLFCVEFVVGQYERHDHHYRANRPKHTWRKNRYSQAGKNVIPVLARPNKNTPTARVS